jgi:hypothetical protein
MAKEFTPEEIEILRKNPNTWSVNKLRISLTKEAKERILELSDMGYSSQQCLRELGYDTTILGKSRCSSVVYNTQRDVRQGKQVHDGYAKRQPKRLSADEMEDLPLNHESYIRMKNELVYLKQEVDFLKKISQLAKSGKRGD